MSEEPNRGKLKIKADILRAQLGRTLESLKQRSHLVSQVEGQISSHPAVGALIGAGSILALAGGTAGLLAYRHRQQGWKPQMEKRFSALATLWNHPDRVVATRHPLMSQIARGVAVSLVSFVASQLLKRAMLKKDSAPQPEPQPI